MVVEDEVMIRLALADLLEGEGMNVLEAQEGDEAIRVLDGLAKPLDIRISDIRLGEGADGWQVAEHARQIDPQVPIIFVSGDSQNEWATRAVSNSIMLGKPVADAKIMAAVERARTRSF